MWTVQHQDLKDNLPEEGILKQGVLGRAQTRYACEPNLDIFYSCDVLIFR